MIDLITLLSAYPVWTVLIIAVASILSILKIIDWCKKLVVMRAEFRNKAILEGEKIQACKDAQKETEEEKEARIVALEKSVTNLNNVVAEQQKLLQLLVESDELDIKAWLKAQHERWIALQCVDSQSLELICQRFDIYAKEGGNSWAQKLVDEIKALPVVTIIPVERQG